MLINFRTLRVAVLCSSRAPGLDVLLRHPQRGKLFQIACVVTTESECADHGAIDAAGVRVVTHPIRPFFAERGTSLQDTPTRQQYDGATAQLLQRMGVDTIVCLGYLYVLSERMLAAFPSRILNIHDSDLTIRDERGERKYVGLRSTRDAILAGEPETRSTVHFVTRKLDGGPVLLLSRSYPVAGFVREAVECGAGEVVKAYAYAHREWMMRNSWGTMVGRALEYVSIGVDQEELPDDVALAPIVFDVPEAVVA